MAPADTATYSQQAQSLVIACCQFDITWEDKPANHIKVEKLLREAGIAPGSLVILPEMFATGFSMNVGTTHDGDGSTKQFLRDLANEFDSWIIAGIVERNDDGRGVNQTILLDRAGTVRAHYNKLHLFSPAGENNHFAAGNDATIFDIAGFKVAPLICYDLRFPELFRTCVDKGAEIFVVLASWPAQRATHWCTLLQARAIENQSYVIGVNRCGQDPHNQYAGQSQAIDPWGNVLADAGSSETVLKTKLHQQTVSIYRNEMPFLKDRK